MTKEIARVPCSEVGQLIAVIEKLGYCIFHPATGEVSGWSSEGEREMFSSKEDGINYLMSGQSIQFWNATDDLFLSFSDNSIDVYFDGYTDEEAKKLMAAFSAAGVNFEIDYNY